MLEDFFLCPLCMGVYRGCASASSHSWTVSQKRGGAWAQSHTSATSFCAHVALLLAHSFSRQPFAMAAGTVAMATAAPVSLFRSGQRGPRVTSRRVSCCRPSRGVVTAAASVEAVPGNSAALVALKGVTLRRASDGTSVDACAIVPTTGRVVVPFLTQFADFDSWELAQRLVDDLPALAEAGVTVVAVGIGSVEAARLFCEKTNFPVDKLFADATGDAYAALKFEPGFGRQGGEFGWLDTKPFSFVNGYAKLLIMCAGIGSPGTLGAVFGGYVVSISHSPHSASLIAHTRLTLFLLQSGSPSRLWISPSAPSRTWFGGTRLASWAGGHGGANSRKMFLLSSRDPVWKGRTNRGTGR